MSHDKNAVQPTPEAIQHAFQLMTGHIVASAVNIAAQLGISEQTVQVQVFRGVKRCEEFLRKRGVHR